MPGVKAFVLFMSVKTISLGDLRIPTIWYKVPLGRKGELIIMTIRLYFKPYLKNLCTELNNFMPTALLILIFQSTGFRVRIHVFCTTLIFQVL